MDARDVAERLLCTAVLAGEALATVVLWVLRRGSC